MTTKHKQSPAAGSLHLIVSAGDQQTESSSAEGVWIFRENQIRAVTRQVSPLRFGCVLQMKSSDEDRCLVAPPPRSCLRSGPIRSRRVTFSQDSWLCEEDPGGGLNDVTQRSQEVDASAVRQRGSRLLGDGRGHTWSLQSDGMSRRRVGVSELSVALGGLLQLVEQHWNGPRSLQRHQQFLGGAYDLLSELLQPAGGGAIQGEGGLGFRLTSQSSELLLLRKLERTEQQLETMKRRLVSALKENYQLKRRGDFSEAAGNLPEGLSPGQA